MNINKISKSFLFLGILSFSLWIGSAVSKVLITYNFFIPPDFGLKSFVNKDTFTAVTNSIAPAYAASMIAFAVLLFCFIAFLFTAKLSLKNNGWLFITTIIMIMLSGIEFYLYFAFDKAFIESVFFGVPDGSTNLNLLIQRFQKLSSGPIVELLSGIVLIFLFLFRPLTKNEN